jgi:hypothetical protein
MCNVLGSLLTASAIVGMLLAVLIVVDWFVGKWK